MNRAFPLALLLALAAPLSAQTPADSTAIRRIMAEGFQHSAVMETARWLTDVYGPRLTGSPLDSAAGEWAMRQMRSWGLVNVHAEPFPFNRPSWLNESFYMQVTAPSPYPVLAMASAWSAGTSGRVTANVVIARIRTADDTTRLRGTLRGKAVLVTAPFDGTALMPAPSVTLSQGRLDEMVARHLDWYVLGHDSYVEINHPRTEPKVTGPGLSYTERMNFFVREGAAVVLDSYDGVGGNFAVYGTSETRVPVVEVAPEHYSRMFRTVEAGTPVTLEFEIHNRISAENAKPVNVLAEITGTDRKDEVVMIGGHLDSWAGGTGATDNGAGVAVMMEAMRILKASGVPLRRTVRIGLWNGEEEGGDGSDTYVKQHFGTWTWRNDPAARQSVPVTTLKPEGERLVAYFNHDNGTGTARGIDRYDNAAVEPILKSWIALLKNDSIHVTHVTSIGNDASDDAVFNNLGVPTFYFVQDPLDYTRGTHHTTQDLYDRLVPDALRHNAVVVALFVYLTANREEMLPRMVRK